MVATLLNVRSWRSLGLLGAALLCVPGVVSAGEEAGGVAQVAEAIPRAVPMGLATGDPERDTLALDREQGTGGVSSADIVSVGQGLRSDGTEAAVNEVPRPWMIKR